MNAGYSDIDYSDIDASDREIRTAGQMRMIDMHAHLSCLEETGDKETACTVEQKDGIRDEIKAGIKARIKDRIREEGLRELRLRSRFGVFTCFSAGTPWEWEAMEQFRSWETIRVSFGIHPWHAAEYETRQCREYLERCSFVGEIGMDSVWCEVPLSVQQKRFEEQLQAATDLGKSVLLHTKGQELRIADMIRDFPGKVCVHWYSGEEAGLERFLERDCYFTLGPDTASLSKRNGPEGRVRRRMLREIPADRLFTETDGISAAAWAAGTEHLALTEIPGILERSLECAARAKAVPGEALRIQMQENLKNFLELS